MREARPATGRAPALTHRPEFQFDAALGRRKLLEQLQAASLAGWNAEDLPHAHAAAAALQRVPGTLRWSANARSYPSRDAFDAELADAVAAADPDWVLCAGYLRILGNAFVERFRGRTINIHPSLLPKFRGLHTHARALEEGENEHGASVHFVIPELDAGAVIAQAAVAVAGSSRSRRVASWMRVRCSATSWRR